MSNLILFWHRRDLRISDNTGLAAARQKSQKVVGVFCLDPNLLERDDVAPVKVTYMIGCLQQLQQRYTQVGSQLLILHANPTQGIPSLAAALNAQAVFWNGMWNLIPNNVIVLLWKPSSKGHSSSSSKLGSTVTRRGDTGSNHGLYSLLAQLGSKRRLPQWNRCKMQRIDSSRKDAARGWGD